MTETLRVPCEMWCEPMTTFVSPGDGGSIGDENTKTSCAACLRITRWLSHDVLPAIRQHGYYAPPGTSPGEELAAMLGQQTRGAELREMITAAVPGLVPESFWDRPAAQA